MELNKIYQGDVIDVLKQLPDNSINSCITSPPYYGLRDYGTATWEGGNTECDHVERINKHGGQRADRNQESQVFLAKKVCNKCGAKRLDSQIGLEETPEEYVQTMVYIFREIRRVLKDDGTVWLNLGDSYAGSTGATGGVGLNTYQKEAGVTNKGMRRSKLQNYKSKDLIGIPWKVAFALQADGWYLRQDIIWHKPNPMPESVKDRCTKSHEYLFLLSKKGKYYYDNEPIKEEAVWKENRPSGMERNADQYRDKVYGKYDDKKTYGGGGTSFIGHSGNYKANGELINPDGKRNKRSVWTVNTKPYREAHFAVFPENLIQPCVLAGCPKDGVILDPFMGSGTTAIVAINNKRNYIGIELNPKYIKIAENRIEPVTTKKKIEEHKEQIITRFFD